VPRQYSTGGKTRLGRITKTGNKEIRKLLVLGVAAGLDPRIGAGETFSGVMAPGLGGVWPGATRQHE
jgi:hypothetical protein